MVQCHLNLNYKNIKIRKIYYKNMYIFMLPIGSWNGGIGGTPAWANAWNIGLFGNGGGNDMMFVNQGSQTI